MIEPRKIANQILTVRENVCEELIHDLHSIEFENIEAFNYATTLVQDGQEKAEKSRKMTRMSSQAGSTPNRDRNFNEINLYITDMALKLVIDDYSKKQQTKQGAKTSNSSSNTLALFLDDFNTKIHEKDSKMTIQEKFFAKPFELRNFFEQLFYKGIMDGSAGTSESEINVLKLAKTISDTRVALSLQAQGILRMQNSNNRKYYQMIKVSVRDWY